jgi:hypothetical protein
VVGRKEGSWLKGKGVVRTLYVLERWTRVYASVSRRTLACYTVLKSVFERGLLFR